MHFLRTQIMQNNCLIYLLIFRLHQEINDFFKWMVPTREEHQMRLTVVQQIETCIQVRDFTIWMCGT